MRHQGKITHWKDTQGFGFITPNGGGQQVFVHISAFTNSRRRPAGNEVVSYQLNTDSKGRARAKSVTFVGGRAAASAAPGRSNTSLVLSAAFLLFVAGATLSGKLPLAVLALYFIASIGTFVAYKLDKSAARNDRWRIQESTLHLFALVGGWPGALLAQRWLHHKSSKQSFQAVFWVTVILNCMALGWLLSSPDAAALAYVRPHDTQRQLNGDAAIRVTVSHIQAIGPVVRLELEREVTTAN